MAFQVRVGGVWKVLSGTKIFSGGSWRSIIAARIFSGGSWRTVTFPTSGSNIAVSISPSPFAFTNNRPDVSGFLTATPTDGVAPYSYAWSVLSSTATVGTGSATVLAVMRLATQDTPFPATLRCTVTDSLGNTAHADVSGTFTRT